MTAELELSPIGTRRIVLLPAKDGNGFMPSYLEVLQPSKQWEVKDHFFATDADLREFGIDYIWSYFSSSDAEASPIRHSRDEVFREVGLNPWEK